MVHPCSRYIRTEECKESSHTPTQSYLFITFRSVHPQDPRELSTCTINSCFQHYRNADKLCKTCANAANCPFRCGSCLEELIRGFCVGWHRAMCRECFMLIK
ncbi:hypothetical protein XELAEV_18040536mg [Xenopus laevis]|uniref:Uncharacterized protein n=1 Tax=Xenopus laevis TaxID=8355 RepID=A0A974C9T0_XENLA|nr:hypothetical protein XELAEV_18040536mg [Xenopus laevis]